MTWLREDGHYTYENTIAVGGRLNVWLNGEPLQGVIECNAREGWAVIYPKDAAGQYIIEGDELATQRVTGVVTVADVPE